MLALDLQNTSLEQVRDRIARIMDQYSMIIRPMHLNGAFRARKNGPGQEFCNLAELWYPPASVVTRMGRMNDTGEVIFYACNKANAAAFEVRPRPGNVVAIMKMHVPETQKIEMLEIGLSRATAPEIQHLMESSLTRFNPGHLEMLGSAANWKRWSVIDDFLCDLLLVEVPIGEEYRYMPSVAISKILRTAPTVDGINYPSVAVALKALKICILPPLADRIFKPHSFHMLQIGMEAAPSLFAVNPFKRADAPDAYRKYQLGGCYRQRCCNGGNCIDPGRFC